MTHDNNADYLLDLGSFIAKAALEAKAEYERSGAQDPASVQLGRLLAYHEVISLMKQQAELFSIDPAAISLSEFDPDRDLL